MPQLERTVRNAVQAKNSQDQAEVSLHRVIQRIMLMGGVTVDQMAVEGMKAQRQTSMERLKVATKEVAETGCLLKDLDTGLVEFPTLLQGEEVYICWQLEEPDISQWHNVHESAEILRPIDKFFIDNHSD